MTPFVSGGRHACRCACTRHACRCACTHSSVYTHSGKSAGATGERAEGLPWGGEVPAGRETLSSDDVPATLSPSTGCPRAAASLQQHAWRTAPLVPSSALAPPAGVADPDTGAGTATRPPAARLPLLSTAPSAPVRFTEPLSATFCLPQRRTRARLRDLRGVYGRAGASAA